MKINPIRTTVTHFVAATGRHTKSERKKMTLASFFNDLENRGPIKFGSEHVFEKWTKKIRKDMQKAKSWIEEDSSEKQNLLFVEEYVSRLQAEAWKENKNLLPRIQKFSSFYHSKYYRRHINHVRVFEDVYMKIRVFGLRRKLFYLQKFLRSTVLVRAFLFSYKNGCLARKCRYKLWHCEIHKALSATPFGFDEVFKYAAKNIATTEYTFI